MPALSLTADFLAVCDALETVYYYRRLTETTFAEPATIHVQRFKGEIGTTGEGAVGSLKRVRFVGVDDLSEDFWLFTISSVEYAIPPARGDKIVTAGDYNANTDFIVKYVNTNEAMIGTHICACVQITENFFVFGDE